MKKYFRLGVISSFVAVLIAAGTMPPATTNAAAYQDVRSLCGSSYTWTVKISKVWEEGVLVVYKNGGTLFCAINYNTSGYRIPIGVSISYGSTFKSDSGNFIKYAGPVVTPIPKGKCGLATGWRVIQFDANGNPGMAAVYQLSFCNATLSIL